MKREPQINQKKIDMYASAAYAKTRDIEQVHTIEVEAEDLMEFCRLAAIALRATEPDMVLVPREPPESVMRRSEDRTTLLEWWIFVTDAAQERQE